MAAALMDLLSILDLAENLMQNVNSIATPYKLRICTLLHVHQCCVDDDEWWLVDGAAVRSISVL